MKQIKRMIAVWKGIFVVVCVCIITADVMTGCNYIHKKESGNTPQSDSTVTVAIDTAKRVDSITAKTETKKADTAVALQRVPLTIIVDHLKSPDAPVVVGVYGPDNKFLDPKDQLKEYHFKPVNGKLEVKVTDLNYGDFAMAIYQDLNRDGMINKNPIGIPKEPYAFSNNYKPVVKAPSFENCKFAYNAKSNTVTMSLLK